MKSLAASRMSRYALLGVLAMATGFTLSGQVPTNRLAPLTFTNAENGTNFFVPLTNLWLRTNEAILYTNFTAPLSNIWFTNILTVTNVYTPVTNLPVNPPRKPWWRFWDWF